MSGSPIRVVRRAVRLPWCHCLCVVLSVLRAPNLPAPPFMWGGGVQCPVRARLPEVQSRDSPSRAIASIGTEELGGTYWVRDKLVHRQTRYLAVVSRSPSPEGEIPIGLMLVTMKSTLPHLCVESNHHCAEGCGHLAWVTRHACLGWKTWCTCLCQSDSYRVAPDMNPSSG